MTTVETVEAVRMLTDDSRDTYAGTAELIAAINEAQIRMIDRLYSSQDERGLRPLYDYANNLTTSASILGTNVQQIPWLLTVTNPVIALRWPRVVSVYNLTLMQQNNNQPFDRHYLEYIEPELWLNYNAPGSVPGQRYPRSHYYTIITQQTNNFLPSIYFDDNNGQNLAEIWFIRQPAPFLFNPLPGTVNVPLEVAPEYHFSICAMAAEILSDIDVGETERSEAKGDNQRLTFNKQAGM